MQDLFDQTQPIKAISLWQPWASLVARGLKIHETRHWSTAYRGAIAIHAARTMDLAGAPDPLCASAFGMTWPTDLPRGAIVAVAELARVRDAGAIADKVTRGDLAAGNFAPARFAWELTKVRALRRPIPTLGRQGLFNWTPPDDLEERLGPILDHEAICDALGWGRIDPAAKFEAARAALMADA